MRRIIAMVPVLAVAAACSAGAGAQEGDRTSAAGQKDVRAFEVAAFDGVSLGGPHDVIVTVGGAPSVRAEGDAEALDRLEVRVDGGTLELGERKRSGFSYKRDRRPVTFYVTAPALRKAGVAGSGTMRIDRVESERFKGSLAGSGDLLIEALRAGRADFSVAGSGDIRAGGAAGNVKVKIAGSGDVDLSGLESRTADISVMGSGEVRTRATERADVSIMGSGDVEVAGGARCTVSKHGSGNVRCG